MRKNLLSLMLGLLLMFLGMLVVEAKAFTGTQPNSVKINRTEFNAKMVKLKALCKNNVGPQCDSAIASADRAAGLAWAICVANINVCQEAQDLAINILNNAVEICRLESLIEYPQASIVRRKNIPNRSLPVNGRKDV